MAFLPLSSPEAQRLRIALDLHDEGVALMRLNLKRARPTASDEQIEALLTKWLLRDPDFTIAGEGEGSGEHDGR